MNVSSPKFGAVLQIASNRAHNKHFFDLPPEARELGQSLKTKGIDSEAIGVRYKGSWQGVEFTSDVCVLLTGKELADFRRQQGQWVLSNYMDAQSALVPPAATALKRQLMSELAKNPKAIGNYFPHWSDEKKEKAQGIIREYFRDGGKNDVLRGFPGFAELFYDEFPQAQTQAQWFDELMKSADRGSEESVAKLLAGPPSKGKTGYANPGEADEISRIMNGAHEQGRIVQEANTQPFRQLIQQISQLDTTA